MRDLLELTLFGSPQICLNGQPVTGFRSSKAQALLYYLAVTGRPHTRPTLAGLLWGDQPEAAARASLSKCLSNLHDLLGDACDGSATSSRRNVPKFERCEQSVAALLGQKERYVKITGIIWLEDIVEKLWHKHSVEQDEVKEVFQNAPYFRFVEKGNREGENVYSALGQTDSGRYLIVFFIHKKDRQALVVSARNMKPVERRQYEQR